MYIDIQSFSAEAIYIICFIIVFAESGIFFLFFLPGDSLLFTLGLIAAQGSIDLSIVIPLLIIAAIAGNFLGYALGNTTRASILDRHYFKKIKEKHIEKAEYFYKKHGSKAVFLSRFVPVLRTFVPFVAGVVKMNYRTYSIFTVLGGITWIVTVVLGGYLFGNQINLQHVGVVGLACIVLAVIATPLFLKLIKRYIV